MSGAFAAALAAFVVIIPVELPDKTFIATLVLSTRYRPLPVWAGAAAAFAIQSAVAAAAGGVIALLPEQPVRVAAGVLFAVGAVMLVRGARTADEEEVEQEHEFESRADARLRSGSTGVTAAARTGWKAFGTTFLVLFLAEWGDLSQLLTAGLVASGRPAVPVFIGSWLGLVLVSGAGVLLGRVILRYVRLQIVRYVGAGVCVALATVIAVEIVASALR